MSSSKEMSEGNHYELSLEEEEYLNANYPSSWDYQSSYGLVIKNFPIPMGYTLEKADMMIIIPQGYPGAALDMFYFSPELKKTNGNTINALAREDHFDIQWQRWSRHYTWVPGQDSIISHIEFVKNALQSEVNQ